MESRDFSEDSLDPEVKRIIDERWKNYLAHPESALTLEQLKEKMAKCLADEKES